MHSRRLFARRPPVERFYRANDYDVNETCGPWPLWRQFSVTARTCDLALWTARGGYCVLALPHGLYIQRSPELTNQSFGLRIQS